MERYIKLDIPSADIAGPDTLALAEFLRSRNVPERAIDSCVLATRDTAQKIFEHNQAVQAGDDIVLDAAIVELMTPSFAHELLTVWPNAQLANASKEVIACWEITQEGLKTT